MAFIVIFLAIFDVILANPVKEIVNTAINTQVNETVQLRTITRDEWLAKEYFSYLCAPKNCLSDSNKSNIKETCFSKHTKLNKSIVQCIGSKNDCNEVNEMKVMKCIMDIARLDPSFIPLELHDCVDNLVSMRTWKCIRRAHLIMWDQIVNMNRNASISGTNQIKTPLFQF